MKEVCIFDAKKKCVECGECDVCDIIKNKICDNCGKCLEIEGIDTKSVEITDLMDNTNSIEVDEVGNEEETLISPTEALSFEDYSDLDDTEKMDIMDMEDMWVYIDDVEEVAEILNDPSLMEKVVDEQYPGLLKLK